MNFQSSHRFLLFAITPATFLRVFHYKKQPNLRLLIGCCLAVLIYLQVFHDDFYTLYQPYLFTVYHSSLELLGVAITWSIFAIAWYLVPREQQRRNLFMGLGFLIIGIMELFHILTYPGMPLSEVVAEGACMLFWYVGRLTLFLTLALALAIPVGSIASPRERNGGLFSSLLLAIGLIYFLPRLSVNPYLLYIPEMTNGYLNIVIELGLSLPVAFLAYLYWQQYRTIREASLPMLVCGLIVAILSNLIFSFSYVYDSFNLLAHFFKILSYMFYYQALVASAIHGPYTQLDQALKQLEASQRELRHLERLKAFGELSSQFAHELKNPLATMRAIAQVGQSLPETSPKGQELFAKITKQVDYMDYLVKTPLALSRETEHQLHREPLGPVLHQVISMVEPELFLANIHLVFDYQRDLPQVSVHPQLLKQALLNIIRNAIEAMPKGGRIRVDLNWEKERTGLVIGISNTASPLPPEIKENIFKPFFTTKENQGTGLGLTITRQIIEEIHNGRIWVDSDINYTTFNIFLPLEAKDGGSLRNTL